MKFKAQWRYNDGAGFEYRGMNVAKVLIVDDSRLYRFSLRRLIQEWGHEVWVAKNGEEAIEMARDILPELILMDIVMPGISGYQAKRLLARDAATSRIPVIFISTRSEETDRIWGLRQGAAAYVTKPVQPELLQTAMTEAMAA
jgi:twitching motility two-component system response regulator PilH